MANSNGSSNWNRTPRNKAVVTYGQTEDFRDLAEKIGKTMGDNTRESYGFIMDQKPYGNEGLFRDVLSQNCLEHHRTHDVGSGMTIYLTDPEFEKNESVNGAKYVCGYAQSNYGYKGRPTQFGLPIIFRPAQSDLDRLRTPEARQAARLRDQESMDSFISNTALMAGGGKMEASASKVHVFLDVRVHGEPKFLLTVEINSIYGTNGKGKQVSWSRREEPAPEPVESQDLAEATV